MDKTVLTLGVDSSQVGTAAVAFEKMTAAGNTAAASGGKVTASANAQGKAISQTLVPAAAKGKVSFADLAAASEKLSPNAMVQITAALAEAEAQAKRTASAVSTVARAANIAPRSGFAEAPTSRTPIAAPTAFSLFTRQTTPVASVAQLTGEAGRAQKAVDRLTAAARTQRSALAQLAPAAATTAASYREIAASPISLAAPQGLAAAASTLATLLATTIQPRQPQQAAGPQRNALAAAAARELAEGNREVASSARLAAFQQQQLAFQVNDFFVQVASGGSALTALIQQGSQLSGTYGGIGNALRALGAQLTPVRLAIGGGVAVVGALAAAFYEGARQSKAFNDSLVLTGNYAGQTAGKVNALAREVAASGQVTKSAARDAAQAVLSTGEVGPQVFGAAVEAVALYAEATGKTADEVARDFASMGRSPSKFAADLNKSMNFITSAQYDAIKAFEDNGRAADAQGVIYDALNTRLKALDPNFGTIERALRGTKNAWKGFWDAAFDIGRPDTIEGKLKNVQDRIAYTQSQINRPAGAPQGQPASRAFALPNGLGKSAGDVLKDQAAEQLELSKRLFREGENAAAEAFRAEANKAAIAADSIIEGYTRRGKAASELKKKQDELERAFIAKDNAGTPISEADKKVARARVLKDFTPAGAGSEAGQVLRAQLDQDIRGFQDALDAERDAFAFHNRFLQGEYQAGNVSLRAFYDDRRETTARAVAAEIAELEQERVRLEQFKSATKDPSEKSQTQTKLNENAVLQNKVKTNAASDIKLSNQEEAASFKALNDQVTNYRANLLQMQGDELGAARLRAQSAISAAQLLAKQASEQPGAAAVDVSGLARAISLTDQFNEAQRQASILVNNSARAEEAFGLAAEQSGKSLIETERGIFAIRTAELTQLGLLTQKAKELAAASTDPRIKAFAADLALEYAKAAAAIDPALNRLRDANKELAAGIATTVGEGPQAFAQEYTQARQAASADVKSQREFFNRKIDQLEGYLATTQDKNDKARLREKIKAAEAQRDSVDGESKGSSVLRALSRSVLEPISQQIFATVNKLLITDPLQKYLEGQLRGLTEGDGLLAGLFSDALGVKADPKDAALALQTAAITSSTTALDLLAQAAQAAAGAVGSTGPLGAPRATADDVGANDPFGAVTQIDQQTDAQNNANNSILQFSKEATAATAVVQNLAIAAGEGTGALGRLPGIVNLFQSIVAAMSTSSSGSSGSGLFGAIAGLFSGGGGSEAGYESMAAYGQYHSGGIVGSAPATRSVASSAFASAPRYHSGGIAGKAADKLKMNEVAAILMGGPKGVREEVITADDPRHRDNLGMNVLARIMAESKAAMRVKGARELGGPVSADSMYRVNEKGPELLQVAGKQYLMTGSQGGNVKANEDGKGGDTYNVTVQVTPPAGASHASAQQFGATAGRHMKNAMRRSS